MEIAVESEAEADRIRATLQLDVAESDNTITVRARNPSESRVRFVWDDKYQINFAWRVQVPRECHVELRTLDGGISVGNLAGRVVARTQAGPISIKRIEGTLEATTQTGDVIVSRGSGMVTARVMRGTIRVGTIGGSANLRNTSGDIEVLAAQASLIAAAATGDVIVGFPRDFAGEAKVATEGGSIYAKIDPAVSAAVCASSVWRHVETLLPMEVESGADGKRKLAGKIGFGTSPITLHANGSRVKLTPGETYFDDGDEAWVTPASGNQSESLVRRSNK